MNYHLKNEKLYTTGNGSHIFLANIYLKQDISSEYAMVDFICMGLLDLLWARTENYKMENLAHSALSGIRTRDLPLTRRTR